MMNIFNKGRIKMTVVSLPQAHVAQFHMDWQAELCDPGVIQV